LLPETSHRQAEANLVVLRVLAHQGAVFLDSDIETLNLHGHVTAQDPRMRAQLGIRRLRDRVFEIVNGPRETPQFSSHRAAMVIEAERAQALLLGTVEGRDRLLDPVHDLQADALVEARGAERLTERFGTLEI